MVQIIQLDRSDLRSVFDEMFRENINNLQQIPRETLPKENLLSEEALTFLKEQGYPITETTLNKKCSLGEIPYKIQGKRRVFSRSQLLSWLSQGCPNVSELKAIDLLALNTRK